MNLTISDMRELFLGQENPKQQNNDSDYEIGKPHNIMTVLGWYKGILTKETPKTLTLENCSWVSESGRFSEYVNDDSVVKEEEPFAEKTKVIIERTSIIGAFQIPKITRKLK